MSVACMKERCILLDGFSKTYAMTGWRMGLWRDAAPIGDARGAPHDELELLHGKLHTSRRGSRRCAARSDRVEAMCAEFKKRRDVRSPA